MNYCYPISIAAWLVLLTSSVAAAQENSLRRDPSPAVVKLQVHNQSATTDPVDQRSESAVPTPPQRQEAASYLSQSNMPPEVRAASFPSSNFNQIKISIPATAKTSNPETTQNPPARTTPNPVIVDHRVAPVSHVAKPKNDLGPITQLLDSIPLNQPSRDSATQPGSLPQPANRLESQPAAASSLPDPLLARIAEFEETENNQPTEFEDTTPATDAGVGKFAKSKFHQLVKHLAINTGIVMCVGIGFILVARQFVKNQKPGRSKPKPETPITIKSTLRLAGKSSLQLVEAGDQRLIVAMDQNGIKSVVKLTDSFASTLDSLEDLTADAGDRFELELEQESGMYSLAQVGQALASHSGEQHSDRETRRSPIPAAQRESQIPTEDEVRQKMEAAMCDSDIKEIFLETLRNSKRGN